MPYIDENDKPALLAYNETTGLVEPVKVDPITGALYVYADGSSSGTFSTLNRAKIDGNDNATLIGYNEDTGEVEALRCESNGTLLINLV